MQDEDVGADRGAGSDDRVAAEDRRIGTLARLSGPTVQAAPDQTWGAIDQALRQGRRGLPGGSSLGRLLVQHRGPEARWQPPRLTVELILAWADQHFARTGDWPTENSGAIPETPGDTWSKIELCFARRAAGCRKRTRWAPSGRPSGEAASRRSTALDHRQIAPGPMPITPPPADGPQSTPAPSSMCRDDLDEHPLCALSWESGSARRHDALPGARRPQATAQTPTDARADPDLGRGPSEGHRRLARRRVRSDRRGPRRDLVQHQQVPAPRASRTRRRTSLVRALGRRSNPVIRRTHTKLTVTQILAWADAHHAATGKWPSQYSGLIPEAPGDAGWRSTGPCKPPAGAYRESRPWRSS